MRLRLRAAGFFALAVVAITCTDAPTSPRDGRPGAMAARHLSMAPSFSAAAAQVYGNLAAFGIEVTEVHVHLTGPDGSIRDTTIAFPVGQDTLVIDIPVDGGGTDQTYTALLELRNGDHVVLFSGTQTVLARTGSFVTDPPAIVAINWTGPGKTTKTVTVGPADTTVGASATIATRATAIDSSGAPVTDLLVRWTSSDATLATVTSTGDITASVVGQGRRGVATISAITPSGITGTSRITFVPPPSRIAVVSGGGQTGVAGTVLAAPLVVEVLASDNLPVAGIPVTFRAVTAGGAVTTATATSDAVGRASTTLTLGKTGGAYQYEAASGTLPAASVTETATPAPPAAIAIVSGNAQTDSVGRALAAPLVAKVTDQYGGASSGATVTWARVTGSGVVGTATSTTAADGLASTTYTLGNTPGGETITATVTGVSGPSGTTTFNATAISRGAAAIALVSGGGQSGAPGVTLATPLVVRVADALNNPVANASVAWTTPSAGTTFTPASSVTDALGQVSTTVKLGTTAGPVVASATTAALVATANLTIVPGPAAIIAKVAGDAQVAEVATNVPVAPSAKVTDASGNAIAGAAVVFSVASGGGSVTAATASTDASGVAAASSWKLGNTTGANTLNATAGALSTTFTATAKSGSATKLAFVTAPPTSITVGAAIPAVSVRITDALDNAVAQAGTIVTATGVVTPGAGTTTVTATTDATGLATFTLPPYVGPTGTAVLTVSAASLTSIASSTITVGAGAPTKLAVSTQPSATAASGAVLAVQPVVQLTDAGGNAVSVAGISVTATIGSGGGTLTGTQTVISTAAGLVTFTDLAISGTAGARTFSFAATGLTSATSNAITLGAGAVASMTKNTGDAQSATAGSALAIAPSVVMKDAAGNPVAGAAVTFAVATGGGSVTASATTTNASGVATVGSWTLGSSAGANTLTATSGTFTATFTATATAGSAAKLALVTAPPSNITVGAPVPPFSVRITDALNNAVATAGVTVTATAVVTPTGETTPFTATTDAAGVATFTPPPYEGLIGSIVLTFSSTGMTSVVSLPVTINIGAPAKLAIKTQPSATASSGVVFGVQPVIQLTDAGDNPTAIAGTIVTAFIGTGGGTLNGTVTATSAADGSMSFTNLGITGTAGIRTLGFNAGTLTGITSNAISLGAGAASAMTKNAGDAQTATAGSAVAIAPRVVVKDAAGNPVAGAPVTFSVALGGGSVTAPSTTTNALGIATVGSWTLGNLAGANSLTATSGSLTATFAATGTSGSAAKLAFVAAPPASITVGLAIPVFTAQITDGLNNAVALAGVTVTATGVITPGGFTSTYTSTSDATGLATFTLPVYAGPTGTSIITVTAPGLTSIASSPITLIAGAAAKLTITTQPSGTAASGAVFPAQPVIQLRDAGNNNVSASGVSVTAAIASGSGTLTGTQTVTSSSAGLVTFTDLALSGTAGTRTLAFTATGLTGATSNTITLGAGAATKITLAGGLGETATVGSPVGIVPSVKVSDASNNGVPGISVTVTPKSGSSANGSTSPITLTTDASGLVTLASWVMGPIALINADTIVFTSTGLTGSPATLVASAIPAAGSKWLVQTQPPTTVASGAILSPAPAVRLADAFGNTVQTPGVAVTASIGTGGGTLGGTLTVPTNALGLAVFSNLSISGTVGSRSLEFNGASNVTAVSNAINVTVGAPAVIGLNGGAAQSATAGSPVPVAPSVKVTDAASNPVSGVVVTFTAVTSGSLVSNGGPGAASVTVPTDASGIAQLTQWTLSGVVGTNTLTATAAVASGSPVTVTAAGTAGAASRLVLSTPPSANPTDGVPLAQQPVVRITDALGNLVVTATDVITAVATSGSGTLSSATATAVGGVATFSGLTITGSAEDYTLAFRSGTLTQAASGTITLGVGAFSRLTITTQPSATAQSGVALAQPPVVQMRDVGNNKLLVAGVSITADILSGGGSITPTVMNTDANGVATFTNLTITGAAGPRVLRFTSGSITVSSTSIDVTSGAPASVTVNAGNLQTATVGTAVSIAPSVLVKDAAGFAVVAAPVTFTVTGGAGSITAGTATTDASGIATIGSWTLGSGAGANTLTATAGAVSATFTATGTAGAAVTITKTAGDAQTAIAGATLPVQPSVLITDAAGNPVSGAPVFFTVTSGGGSRVGSPTNTNASGIATVGSWTLGTTPGANTLSVTSNALTTTFTATATAGAAAKLLATGVPTSVKVGAAITPSPLAVQVADALGNAVNTPTPLVVTMTGTVGPSGTTFSSTANTNASGVASFALVPYVGPTGTLTLSATSGALAEFTSVSIPVTTGDPSALVITTQPPATTVSGVILSVAPTVQVVDAGGNAVNQGGLTVTAAFASGTGSLSGQTAPTNSGGLATFNALAIGGSLGPRTLRFSSGSLISPTSGSIDIVAGAPATIAKYVGDAQTATAGSAVAVAPQVRVFDASGNPVAGVSVTFGSVTGGGSITGTNPVTTDALGFAAIGSWTLGTTVGTNTLTASAGSLNAVFSATGTAGVGSVLALTTQPSATATNGAPLATQPIIQLRDANGNAVTGPSVTVTATISSGSGSLANATAVTDGTGKATFAGLTITGTAGNFTLSFGAPSYSAVVSNSIALAAGAAAAMTKTAGDALSATVGTAVATAPQVRVLDANGNPVAGVSVTFGLVTGGGSITGTNPVTTNASGFAAIGSWTLGTTAGANTLTVTAGSLNAVFSATGTAGVGSVLALTTQPSATATNGAPLATQPIIQLRDASGNAVTGPSVTVTASISSGAGTLANATAVTDGTGKAIFAGLTITGTAGNFTLDFTAPTYAAVSSSTIALGAGIAAKLAITTNFSDGQSGVPFATQPVVRLLDSGDNPVGQAGIPVTVAIVTGGGTLSGTNPVNTIASGVATFTDLVVTGSAGSRTFSFSAPGLPTINSLPINLAAGTPTRLAITTAPPATAQNDVALTTQPVIQLVDDANNPVSFAGLSIFADLDRGGSVRNHTAITNATGAATFSGLAIQGLVGTYTINFTSSSEGLGTVQSGTITLSAGLPVQIAFLQQPTSTIQDVAIAPPVTVQVRDDIGNPVTADGGYKATVALSSPGDAILAGTLTVPFVSGVATFSDLKINLPFSYQLVASTDAPGLSNVTSNEFAITAAGQPTISVETGAQTAARPGEQIPAGKIVYVVKDGSAKPISGRDVSFNTFGSDDCNLTTGLATTDANGHVTLGINLGRLGSGCLIHATAVGVELSAVAQVVSVPLAASHVWISPDQTGVSSFETKENWLEMTTRTPQLPTATSVAYVPTWFTNVFPQLSNDESIGGLIMMDSSSVDLNGKTLTTSRDINASLGYMYNGAVIATGTNVNISGLFDALTLGKPGACVGAAAQTANLRSVIATGSITAGCGVFVDFAETAADFNSVAGSFVTVNPAGALIASTSASFAGDSVSITGDGTIESLGTASFDGRLRLDVNSLITVSGAAGFTGTGSLSAGEIDVVGDVTFAGSGRLGYSFDGGLMKLFGNFIQKGTGPIFNANALHQTNFRGSTTQTIQMETPSVNSFGEMNLENTGGGVTLLSSLTTQPLGGFTPSLNVRLSQLKVPNGLTLTLPGDMYFYSGGNMLLDGVATFRSCNSDGAVSPISGSGTANGKPAGSVSCVLNGGAGFAARSASEGGTSSTLKRVPLRPFPVRPVVKRLR